MQLKRIYFDAYRSLLERELTINHNCLGFVGTNESGKSNVLAAINILGGGKTLASSDTPKMDRNRNPQIRYEFSLTESEFSILRDELIKWSNVNTFGCENGLAIRENSVIYTVRFNKETGNIERFFSFNSLINISSELLFLDSSQLQYVIKADTWTYFIKSGNEYRSIDNSLVVNINTLKETEQFNQLSYEHEQRLVDLAELENELSVVSDELEGLTIVGKGESTQESEFLGKIEQKKLEMERLIAKRAKIEPPTVESRELFEGYGLADSIERTKKELAEQQSILDLENQLVAKLNARISTLSKIAVSDRTPEQKEELSTLTKKLNTSNEAIQKASTLQKKLNNDILFFKQPISQKYTSNIDVLLGYLNDRITGVLLGLLPKVVFWENSANYILKSETSFYEIESKKELSEISRPLVNLFRIGLDVKTIDELKKKVDEIKKDANERSRINRILDSKVNNFIRRVWQDYDQKIHITLERDQIRIEIFDPNNDVNSGYYSMSERSQGCQTFLSFLMTIGAEAEHNVINNVILLLDEPETHLHPSGVRYMLQELIKISERNNLVMYATHSIFLIDKNNLDRHIILKKEKEHTLIYPANIGRVGYFMQEEVLYNTLDLKIGKDFTSNTSINFVFEGDGDASLFSHYYEKILKDSTRPYKLKWTSFYQGGKCSDIEKYFTQRPIQLGTKWIFILDNDKPASGLKSFIQKKYADYVHKDIFIFQYKLDNDSIDITLEDLLPEKLIVNVYKTVFEKMSIPVTEEKIERTIIEKKKFNSYGLDILNEVENKEDRELCKGKFKELLNQTIKKEAAEKKEKNSFDTFFSKYSRWVEGVIDELMPEKGKDQKIMETSDSSVN